MSRDIKASGSITARCRLYWRQSRRRIRRAFVGAVEVVVLRLQVVNVFLSPCLRGLDNIGRHAGGGCFALRLLVASYLSANTRALGCLIGGSISSGARHRRRRRAVTVERPRNVLASTQAQHQAASAQNTQTPGRAQRVASAPDRVSWVHRCEYGTALLPAVGGNLRYNCQSRRARESGGMVDALALGASGATRESSSLSFRILLERAGDSRWETARCRLR